MYIPQILVSASLLLAVSAESSSHGKQSLLRGRRMKKNATVSEEQIYKQETLEKIKEDAKYEEDVVKQIYEDAQNAEQVLSEIQQGSPEALGEGGDKDADEDEYYYAYVDEDEDGDETEKEAENQEVDDADVGELEVDDENELGDENENEGETTVTDSSSEDVKEEESEKEEDEDVTKEDEVKYCGVKLLDGTLQCKHPHPIKCVSYLDCDVQIEVEGDFVSSIYKECLPECAVNVTLEEASLAESAQEAKKAETEALKHQEAATHEAVDLTALSKNTTEIVVEEKKDATQISGEEDEELLAEAGVVTAEKYCGLVDIDGEEICNPKSVMCKSDADCEESEFFTDCLPSCGSQLEIQDLSVSGNSDQDEDDVDLEEEEGELELLAEEEYKEFVEELIEAGEEGEQKDDPLDEAAKVITEHSAKYCGKDAVDGPTECDNRVVKCDDDSQCADSLFPSCLSECKMILFSGQNFDEHQDMLTEQMLGTEVPPDTLVEYFEPGSDINKQTSTTMSETESALASLLSDVGKYCGVKGDEPGDLHCRDPFLSCQTDADCQTGAEDEFGDIYTQCLQECGEVKALCDPIDSFFEMPTEEDPTTVEKYYYESEGYYSEEEEEFEEEDNE